MSDRKGAENKRRIELGMLGLLIEQYPSETREKLRKMGAACDSPRFEKTLVLRE